MVKANISWITEDLATGGDLSYDPAKAADQMHDILAQGVAGIIDVREEDDDTEVWEGTGVEYVRLPTADKTGHHIPTTLFDAAVEQARQWRNRKVLVHCHMGVNRGPSVAYAVLLDRGVDPIEAFDQIRAARWQAGLVYAQDALLAHLLRANVDSYVAVLERGRLKRHIRSIWTPDEQLRIDRIIRKGHETDRREWVKHLRRVGGS